MATVAENAPVAASLARISLMVAGIVHGADRWALTCAGTGMTKTTIVAIGMDTIILRGHDHCAEQLRCHATATARAANQPPRTGPRATAPPGQGASSSWTSGRPPVASLANADSFNVWRTCQHVHVHCDIAQRATVWRGWWPCRQWLGEPAAGGW